MIMLRRQCLALAAGAVLSLASWPLQAQQVADAGQFVARLAEQAITGLTSKSQSDAERSTQFRRLLNDGFDVKGIGRFVLGRYGRTATDAERAEYDKLFEDLIVQTYAHRFAQYAGEKLRVLGTKPGDAEEFTVASEMTRPTGGAPVRIDWRVRRNSGAYKVTDVVVEGVSMSITQRDEFSAVVQREGGKVAGLLRVLQQKVGQMAKTGG